MLFCGINEVTEGMTVAASVFHPRRPEVELLTPGVVLEAAVLERLAALGVASLWVQHDLTTDLDALVNPTPSAPLHTAFQQIKHDFAAISGRTVSAGQVAAYRQIVMELVCELVANRHVSGLTERLIGGPPSLFTHSANVAYLSISAAIELETYIVQQRRQMALENARDLTALGIGAMLHDVGKVALPEPLQGRHAADFAAAPPDDPDAAEYRRHALLGYQMLADSRTPASARQVVLAHHQRWDGRGFPDLSEATQSRREGTQEGEAIHIFSRIVAAADTLDALMHGHAYAETGGPATTPAAAEPADPATPPAPPMVAALHRFAGSEFDGWFDPVVRDTMLRRFPPFGVGARVVLSDGRAAVVVAPSVEQPCRPTVRLLEPAPQLAGGDEDTKGEVIDLRLARDTHITRCGGVDVEPYLFELPERSPLVLTAVTGKVA